MIPEQTLLEYPVFGDNATKVEPDNNKKSNGWQQGDVVPAEWMNWGWYHNSKGITDLNRGLNSVEDEIINVLNETGQTPTENNNTQLFTGIQKISGCIASSDSTPTVLTGPELATGCVIRVMFMADVTGADTTTGLVLNYNGTNKSVKFAKNGSLFDFVAIEVATSTYKYIQRYTVLEFVYDGNYLVIVGNPVVLSSGTFKYHADGFNDVEIYDIVGTSYKGQTYSSSYSNPVLTLPKGSYLVLISGQGYSANLWELDLIISSGSAFTVRNKIAGGSINPTVTVTNNKISAKYGNNDLYIYATVIGSNWAGW